MTSEVFPVVMLNSLGQVFQRPENQRDLMKILRRDCHLVENIIMTGTFVCFLKKDNKTFAVIL